MYIVLVANRTRDPGYKDVPFHRYHFPSRYRSSINTGDLFIYNQGNKSKKEDRIYYGMGVVGDIYPDPTAPDHFYADLLDAVEFDSPISIYLPDDSYYESIDYQEVKKNPQPAWQNAVRRISKAAFEAIVSSANMHEHILQAVELSEVQTEEHQDWLLMLNKLNLKYSTAVPSRRSKILNQYLDRGVTVVSALKEVLGAFCQICAQEGFKTRSGKRYIEAHHLNHVANQVEGSLCSDNLILVCPTCHRKLHHAELSLQSTPSTITISINGEPPVTIQRNTLEHLLSR